MKHQPIFNKNTTLRSIELPKVGPCWGMVHEFKMILYKGGRAYRCDKCTWLLPLRKET